MKAIKFLFAAMIAGFAFTACNSGETNEGESDTIIIEDDSPAQTSTPKEEEKGNSIGFDINSDEDGNVSGGVKGDIDLDKK